ncbi:MAG: hypothetical protein HOB64_06750 [Rhodospirillaceae bacterium]|jgi:hypothetical protein|nr:hypothetical protein [Rhodospirillaceae bacterium]MBT4720422.1 hypothetical protein [Rhodospirillaceae bacterium]MBT5178416.1 hypothetical protein [Rhodospirillaceae bacterium]MBT6292936.1 hypothetical protein [Rhodospirillaceae bacterium]MBT6860440.1 hypothetical protein [Rhodospirillaceae bacterium]
MRFLIRSIGVLIGLGAVYNAVPASAHAFGQRYDLPLPLWMFVSGAAAAVVLSFAVIAVFLRHKPAPGGYATVNMLNNPIGRFLAHPILLGLVRTLFVAWFLLTVAAGFFGVASPYENLSVVMVWVIAWVGLAFVCSLLGNFWALINPWNAIFSWAEALTRKLTGGGELSRNLPVPLGWDTWPAFIFFFIFAWMEISWPGSGVPKNIAVSITVYSGLTWLGMFLYGRETWLAQGEAFSVVYGLFARFAVTEVRVRDAKAAEDVRYYDIKNDDAGCVNGYGAFFKAGSESREWNLRPPGVGLRVGKPPSITLMFFVLLLLSTVTFDGYTETQQFADIGLVFFKLFQGLGGSAVLFVETIWIASFPILLILVYLLFIYLVGWSSDHVVKFSLLAPTFVFSIVPIAIAYHLSHYLSLLVIEGQVVIHRLSDPFGFGWDLFGTADYKVDIALIDAKFVWFFSVAAIVIGHIVAVYLSHTEAMRLFGNRRRALDSQLPMLALMVGYTMLSLWIIAQPIVA